MNDEIPTPEQLAAIPFFVPEPSETTIVRPRSELAQCQKEMDAYEHGAHMFNEWCGNFYEWDALTDLEKQRWNRLAWRSRSNNEQLAQARREAENLRLTAADRMEWQDVAMKVSAERDSLRTQLETANKGMARMIQLFHELNIDLPDEGLSGWDLLESFLTRYAEWAQEKINVAVERSVAANRDVAAMMDKIVAEVEDAMSFDGPRNTAGTWLNEIRSIALSTNTVIDPTADNLKL